MEITRNYNNIPVVKGDNTNIIKKELENGQAINGKVIEISDGNISIKLQNGDIISGKFPQANLNIGDISDFIAMIENGAISFSAHKNINEKQFLADILNDYNLNYSDENIKIIEQLLNSNMPVTKENIVKLNQAIKLTGNVEEAIFLIKNEFVLNEKNAELVKDFATGNIKIQEQIYKLTETINNIKDPIVKKEILKFFDNIKAPVYIEDNTQSELANPGIEDLQPDLFVDKPQLENNRNFILADKTVLDDFKQNLIEILKPYENITIVDNSNFEQLLFDIVKLPKEIQAQAIANTFELPISDKQTLINHIKTLFKSIDEPKNILNKLSFNIKNSNPKHIDEFFNEIKISFEEITKNPELKQNVQLKDIFEKIEKIEDSIKFFNDTKEFLFVQLPINFQNEIKQSDMYFFKEKGKNKSNKSANALISIDTANLGKFESYIQKNNRSVTISFRLEDEIIEEYVKENITKLNDMLKNLNYSLDGFSFKNTNGAFTIVKNEESLSSKKQEKININTVFFDIKT